MSSCTIAFVITRFLEPWNNITELYGLVQFYRSQSGPNFIPESSKFIIHNRGPAPTPEEAKMLPPTAEIITTENIGREAFVILKYINDNYDSLPDTVIFCPASWKDNNQKIYAINVALKYHDKQSFIPQSGKTWGEIYDSVVDCWYGTTPANIDTVKTQPFHQSAIRPFGAWYEARIKATTGREWHSVIAHFGIFSVHRANILRYSKAQWEDWLSELAVTGPNTELAHYWEYSWASLLC
jgi:hypothetical protein